MQPSGDYAFLDRPEILNLVFYPRQDWRPPPPGAQDHAVPVAESIVVSCRLYPSSRQGPVILFFHGNGEVVSEHDDIAHLYNEPGINLWVADYRGYGHSGGVPTFSAMMADAHAILDFLLRFMASQGYSGPLFVMGRSLGAYSAVELAISYPGRLAGLIVESGGANPARLLRRFGGVAAPEALEALEKDRATKLQALRLPVLVIHGEWDSLIPLEEAIEFHQLVGSSQKELLIIPGAEHNDILFVGLNLYMGAIKSFVLGEGEW